MMLIANFAVVIAAALFLSYLFEKIRLPGLLGMVITGILLGPYVLNFISSDILKVSAELRTLALIVILIRAGLGISRATLNKVGASAIKMSFIPGILEGSAILFLAHYWMGFSWTEAGMLGFIIAAVSPAVVVPQMLDLKEKGYSRHKEVPTLVLAGASLDDVFAITIFGVFMALHQGKGQEIGSLVARVPLSIVLGIAGGLLLGFLLSLLFARLRVRTTRKALTFLLVAILFHELEKLLPIASLLGIMAMGFVLLEREEKEAHALANKFNKVWVFAELVLFILIGAQVDITVAWNAGLIGLAIIGLGLLARSMGVILSLMGSELNYKERLFCVISYLPKATVQAAIGAVPLASGVGQGSLILAIAVLSIIVTAPLGAVGITLSAPRLLDDKA